MRSRLLTVASGVSLLVCAALSVLWARSGRVMDGVLYCDPSGAGGWSHCLHTRHGALYYLYTGPPQSTPPGWKVLAGPQPPQYVAMVDRPRWRVLGFAGGGVGTFWFVSAPFWSLVLTAGVLPTVWLVRRARRRLRPDVGVCPKCGYDLRATPGRCPECGTAAAATEQ